ncbi:MAG: 30S ribosomal protein S2 [Patescibacteria group bacterium]
MLPTLIELAKSGAHYGHHRSFVYPKAQRFVFGVRKNIALIDLEKTLEQLTEAQKVIGANRAEGKTVLFVGTRRGVKEIVKRVAEEFGEPYVTERWLGGFLTNFEGIHENIKKMNELDEYLASEHSKGLTKIERLRQTNKLARYHRFLAGVTKLNAVPGLMVMASASEDKIALKEANLLGIPVIAICDTDTNPDKITYPIPANDDAATAVELILRALVAAPIKTVKATKVEGEVSPAEEPVVETATKKILKPKAVKKITAKKVTSEKKSTARTKPVARKTKSSI